MLSLRIIYVGIATFAPIFCCCSVSYGQQLYKIIGYLAEMPDQEVYLDYYDQGIKYRHKTVSKGGGFEFAGTVSEPVFANIHHQHGKGEIELFLDNSVWRITGFYSDYDSAAVAGSVIDKQWKEYFKEDQTLVSTRVRNGLLPNELLSLRVDLLKKYVRKYSDSYAGALIPTFCTIEKSLTHSDWIEIYEMLSPKMKKTYYGKKVRAKVDKR